MASGHNQYLLNEQQNPRHKLDDKCLCYHTCSVLILPVQSLLTCFRSITRFSLLKFVITLPQTVRLFYVSLRSQAPQQQYTIHCMHYGITLRAYLSELRSQKTVTNVTSYLITYYRYIHITERYTETLHVKKWLT